MSSDKEEIYNNIDDVRCPYCGNPVNWKRFSHWSDEKACYLAGCWSGSVRKNMPEHIFKIWVTVGKDVYVTQETKEDGE